MKKFNPMDVTYVSVIYENILGKGSRRIILEDGSVILEKTIKNLSRYTFIDFFDEYYKDSYLEKKDTPHLICSGCATLTQLENLCYDPNVIKLLNEKGLEIYLYETCYFDILPKKNISIIFTELTKPNILSDDQYKNCRIGFESSNTNLENIYCLEFESIKKFVDLNNLSNVTIKVVDYNINRYFKRKYPTLKIETEDICLVSMFKDSVDSFTGYEYVKDQVYIDHELRYKFWSGNKRYEGYRHLISSVLLQKNSLISFNVAKQNIQDHLWFDLANWKYYDFFDNIQQSLDTMFIEETRNFDNIRSQCLDAEKVPTDSYNQCFCAVITESKFAQPTATFSEKTLNAIKCFRPFILVAPPHTLKFLHSYGIKTFSDWWDESYDQEEHHEKRLIKIIELIEKINQLDLKELQSMLKEMKTILEDNYKIINKIPKCPNLLIF